MTEQTQQLRQAVSNLHQALQAAHDLDPEMRTLLEQTLLEVHGVLSAANTQSADRSRQSVATEQSFPLRRQLGEAAAEFEGSHPTLAGTVRSVIDALAQIGI